MYFFIEINTYCVCTFYSTIMRRRVRRVLYLFMFFTWTKKKGFGVFSTCTYEYTGCRTLKNNQKRGKLPVNFEKLAKRLVVRHASASTIGRIVL